MVSGVFYISGEYKITEGLLEREKFNFELPFDIALTNNYDTDSLLVDIDDFRYDLISDKNLKVNIDLYIDGEEILPPEPRNSYKEELIIKENDKDIREITEDILSTIRNDESNIEIKNNESDYQENINLQKKLNNEKELIQEEKQKNIDEETSNIVKENTYEKLENKDNDEKILKEYQEKESNKYEEVIETKENEITDKVRIDLLKDMLTSNKEDNMNEELNLNINNNNNQLNNESNNETESETKNNNLFIPDGEEKYVTYRVYTVLDTDNIDTILTKYNITKESLADYNNIENINPGDKLIIPTYEK